MAFHEEMVNFLNQYETNEIFDKERNRLVMLMPDGCFRVCSVTGPLTGWPKQDLRNKLIK